MATTKEQKIITAGELKKFIMAVSLKHGVSQEDSEIFADSLVDANLAGIDTHGVTRLSIYLKRIKLGLINPKPQMKFEQKFPTAAILDADNGLGQVAGVKAIKKAVEIAQEFGVSAVGIKHSQHFGALSYYCNIATKGEVIAFAYTNAEPALPPWGSYKAYFGTNPIAMGVPDGNGNPILIDLSTSIVARGKIISASKQKTPIPEGWALDPEGNPTTDPDKALTGSVLTMAGPKGYALAMMVDIMSGVLSGSGNGNNVHSMYKDLSHPAEVGHFFICLNIEAFMKKKEFFKRIENMKKDIKNSAKRQGIDEIRIPGERGVKTRAERLKNGIHISMDVVEELKTLAKENGINFSI